MPDWLLAAAAALVGGGGGIGALVAWRKLRPEVRALDADTDVTLEATRRAVLAMIQDGTAGLQRQRDEDAARIAELEHEVSTLRRDLNASRAQQRIVDLEHEVAYWRERASSWQARAIILQTDGRRNLDVGPPDGTPNRRAPPTILHAGP